MKRDKHSISGQAMVEACIGLMLLSFVLILVTHSSFMSINSIRVNMAARHAAWLAGHKHNPTASELHRDFFYTPSTDVVGVNVAEGKGGMMEALTGNDSFDIFSYRKDKWVRVSFGISQEDQESAALFPFSLMRTRVPLMPESQLESFTSVKAHCQWESVVTTWSDGGDAWDAIKSFIGSGLSGIPDAVTSLLDGLF